MDSILTSRRLNCFSWEGCNGVFESRRLFPMFILKLDIFGINSQPLLVMVSLSFWQSPWFYALRTTAKQNTRSYVGVKRPTLRLIWQVQNMWGNASGDPFQSMPSRILLGMFQLCIEEPVCTLNGGHNPIFAKVTATSSQIMPQTGSPTHLPYDPTQVLNKY